MHPSAQFVDPLLTAIYRPRSVTQIHRCECAHGGFGAGHKALASWSGVVGYRANHLGTDLMKPFSMILLIGAIAISGSAQTPLAFDVVSIKPNKSGERVSSTLSP